MPNTLKGLCVNECDLMVILSSHKNTNSGILNHTCGGHTITHIVCCKSIKQIQSCQANKNKHTFNEQFNVCLN